MLHTNSSSYTYATILAYEKQHTDEFADRDKEMAYTKHKELPYDVDPSPDTLTCQKTIDKMENWLLYDSGGIAFCICIRNPEGKHFLYYRSNQPCWGELRTHYKDIYKPSDLHHPFPHGTPVGIGCSYTYGNASFDFLKWATSDQSPWKNGFRSVHLCENKKSFIICNTHIDPTVTVNLLLQTTHQPTAIINWKELINRGLNLKDAWLLALSIYQSNPILIRPIINDYTFSPYIDLEKYYKGEPDNITIDQPTLYLRGAYNRVLNSQIWKGGWSLTKELKPLHGKTIEDAKEFFSKLHERIGF